jgi:PAS domain S-box-containing protein
MSTATRHDGEERFRAYYKNMPIPTYVWQSVEDDFVLRDYNHAATQVTRGDIARLIGQSARVMYAEQPDIIDALSRCALEQTSFMRELPYRLRTTGELQELSVMFVPVPPDLVMVHAEDITERKQAEEKLRENEARLSETQRISHLGSWELDLRTNQLVWSNEIFRIFEIDPQKFGASYEAFLNAIHPDDREAVNHAYTESVENKTPYTITHRLLMTDGRVKWALEQCETFYDDEGTPIRSIGTVQDITDLKRIEDALHESEAHLHTVINHAPLVLFAVDRQGIFTLSVGKGLELLGLQPRQVVGLSAFELYGDVPQVANNLRRALMGETVRFISMIGPLAFEAIYMPQYDAQGKLIGATGIGFDITERHRAEDALRKLSSAIEQTADPVIITDKDGTIEYVNAAFTHITGYAATEAVGQTPRLLRSNTHPLAFYQTFWETILAGQAWRGVFVNRKKNGELYFAETTVTPLLSSQGELTHFVSVEKDITESKRREREREAIITLSTALRVATSRAEMLPILLTKLMEVLEISGAALSIEDPVTGEVQVELGCGEWADISGMHLPPRTGVSGRVITTGQPYLNNDIHSEQHPSYALGAVRAVACVPLIAQQQAVGALWVGRQTPITPVEVQVLTALGDIAANAIHRTTLYELEQQHARENEALALANAQLLVESQRRADEFAALYAISRDLSAQRDLPNLLQTIVDSATQLVRVPIGTIWLYRPSQNQLELVAGKHTRMSLGTRFELGEGVIGLTAQTRQPVVVNDYERWEHRLTRANTHQLTSAGIGVPLLYGGELIGVLGLAESTGGTHQFTEVDERLLSLLASQAASAVHNAHLLETEQRRLLEALALQHVTEAISAHLNLDDLLVAVVESIAQITHYHYISVWLAEADGLRLKAQHGFNLNDQPTLIPHGQGISGRVMRTGQAALVPDVRQDPDYLPVVPTECSLIVAPLHQGPQRVGVLGISATEERPLDENDLNWVWTVSQQLSVALENARLYEEQKRLLREREQTQAQLVHSEKMSALGRLVASLAHEINNPLQSVQGCLSLAQEALEAGDERATLERFLNVAHAEIERIAALVTRMRDFYMPADTGMQLVTLPPILESVLALTHKQLEHSHVRVERRWEATEATLEANASHLKQVFLNLILNAIDAMPQGGTLRVSTALDEQTLAQPAIRIEFQDTGSGIAPQMLPRLFEPFFTTKRQGTGLGLSISYGIVQAHHGAITVESEMGKGTTFRICLPLSRT